MHAQQKLAEKQTHAHTAAPAPTRAEAGFAIQRAPDRVSQEKATFPDTPLQELPRASVFIVSLGLYFLCLSFHWLRIQLSVQDLTIHYFCNTLSRLLGIVFFFGATVPLTNSVNVRRYLNCGQLQNFSKRIGRRMRTNLINSCIAQKNPARRLDQGAERH
jgi:hypothetical protein